jgi:diacylglycerol kinase (ATP)
MSTIHEKERCMRKHDVKFIVNPNANLGRAWRQAADLRPIMAEYGGADWAGSVYPTHSIELTRQAVEEGYSLIIAGGGDGTVHEMINGIMEYPPEKRPQIGVVPLGSGNDFASSLGMDPVPWKALRQIFNGKPRKVDVASIKDQFGRKEYCSNTIGIGFDAIVTIYSHQLPIVRGFLMYFTAVMKTIFLNHDPMRMDILQDGEKTWKDDLLMLTICNGGREGGGFQLAPDSKIDDGILDLVAVQDVSRLKMLGLIPRFIKGNHATDSKVIVDQFSEIKIQSDSPLYIHTDGEIFSGFSSNLKQIRVQIASRAVEFLC